MTTRLIIARHGNTFTKEQTPTRVGAKTDLHLVEEERGRNIGKYLRKKNISVDLVFCGPLKRHIQTAALACEELGGDLLSIQINHDFNEIDYGPDENKTEEEVMLRLGNGNAEIGKTIIDLWNKEAKVPQGWEVDVEGIKQSWLTFADDVAREYNDQTILLVSSNGTIRFSPIITGDFDGFISQNDIKVSTGGVCIFEKDETDTKWRCVEWGTKPAKELA